MAMSKQYCTVLPVKPNPSGTTAMNKPTTKAPQTDTYDHTKDTYDRKQTHTHIRPQTYDHTTVLPTIVCWLMQFRAARADLVYWAREPAHVQRARPARDVDVGLVAALTAPYVPPAEQSEAKVKH
jgi:hypothetical protein